jgi:protein TonB
MEACASPCCFELGADSGREARKRVCAALAASVAIHLIAALAIRGGAGTDERPRALHRYIEARLVEARPATTQPGPELQQTAPALPRLAGVLSRGVAPELAREAPASEIATAHTPDNHYYSARELDVYPAPAASLQLRYPLKAAAARVTGHVLLSIAVEATGTVTDVKVLDSEPSGYFDEGAVQTMLATQFTPALKNGRPVRSRVAVQIVYSPELH